MLKDIKAQIIPVFGIISWMDAGFTVKILGNRMFSNNVKIDIHG